MKTSRSPVLNEQAVSERLRIRMAVAVLALASTDALDPPPHVTRKALRPNDQIVTRARDIGEWRFRPARVRRAAEADRWVPTLPILI